MPLEPLEEQRRIVGRTDELAARIGEARKLRQEVSEEADALFDPVLDGQWSNEENWKHKELVNSHINVR